MPGVAGALIVVDSSPTVTVVPGHVAGPWTILDLPGPARAIVAFGLVSLLGGVLLWRYGSFVDRSIDASMARPLSSLGYGAAAHAVIAFGGLYLSNQLSQISAFGAGGVIVGVLAGLFLVLLAAALGFTVVGSTVVEFQWGRRPWYGLAVGAVIAGVAGFFGLVPGGLLWFVVVSMGIGGPTRRWLHAVEGVEQ